MASDEQQSASSKVVEEGAPPSSNNSKDSKRWNSIFEFSITSIGYSVSLANIWRFPNMVFSNGGGAFFLPYWLSLIFIAIPMLLVEAALGQSATKGPIGASKMVPLFRGCTIAAVILSLIDLVYYTVPISWAAFYLASSLSSPLPWTTCGYWASNTCSDYYPVDPVVNRHRHQNKPEAMIDLLAPATFQQPTCPIDEYFYQRVTGAIRSLPEWGTARWELMICSLTMWFIIFAAVSKGSRWLGKTAYVTIPLAYFMLTAILIFASTLPGVDLGIKYYLRTNASKLADVRVWRSAVSHVLFSTGFARGGVIHCNAPSYRSNIVRYTIIVPLLTSLTSIWSGFAMFTVIGYMSQLRGVSAANIQNVAQSGPGLTFLSYPEVLSQMPGTPSAWSFLFFLMIFIVGVSNQFFVVETICNQIGDHRFVTQLSQRSCATRLLLKFAVCVTAFLISLFFFFGNGYLSFYLIDERVIGYPMIIIGFAEAIIVAWIYGSDRLMSNIEEMTGAWRHKWLKFYWIACWKIVAPGSLALIFILDLAMWEPAQIFDYTFPPWALAIAALVIALPLGCIFFYALHVYWTICRFQKLRNAVWWADRPRSGSNSESPMSSIGGMALNFPVSPSDVDTKQRHEVTYVKKNKDVRSQTGSGYRLHRLHRQATPHSMLVEHDGAFALPLYTLSASLLSINSGLHIRHCEQDHTATTADDDKSGNSKNDEEQESSFIEEQKIGSDQRSSDDNLDTAAVTNIGNQDEEKSTTNCQSLASLSMSSSSSPSSLPNISGGIFPEEEVVEKQIRCVQFSFNSNDDALEEAKQADERLTEENQEQEVLPDNALSHNKIQTTSREEPYLALSPVDDSCIVVIKSPIQKRKIPSPDGQGMLGDAKLQSQEIRQPSQTGDVEFCV